MERICKSELEEYKIKAAQALITEMQRAEQEYKSRNFSFKGRDIGYVRRGLWGWFPQIFGTTCVTFSARQDITDIAGIISRISNDYYACNVTDTDPVRLECKRIAPGY